MDLLWMILIGFFAGFIARAIMPGVDNAGFVTTTVLGIIGSLLSGFFCQMFHIDNSNQIVSFIGAIVGSFVILALFKVLDRKRKLI